MINAAIVGLGRWGRTLVTSVQGKSDRLRFAMAVTRDPERSRDFLERHGLAPVSALEAALADNDIDAVVLATPHSQHADQIVAVAATGKAVFCEKPLTLTRAEAERAVAACRDAGIVLGVGTDKTLFPGDAGIGPHRGERRTRPAPAYRGQFQQRGGGDDVLAVA